MFMNAPPTAGWNSRPYPRVTTQPTHSTAHPLTLLSRCVNLMKHVLSQQADNHRGAVESVNVSNSGGNGASAIGVVGPSPGDNNSSGGNSSFIGHSNWYQPPRSSQHQQQFLPQTVDAAPRIGGGGGGGTTAMAAAVQGRSIEYDYNATHSRSQEFGNVTGSNRDEATAAITAAGVNRSGMGVGGMIMSGGGGGGESNGVLLNHGVPMPVSVPSRAGSLASGRDEGVGRVDVGVAPPPPGLSSGDYDYPAEYSGGSSSMEFHGAGEPSLGGGRVAAGGGGSGGGHRQAMIALPPQNHQHQHVSEVVVVV